VAVKAFAELSEYLFSGITLGIALRKREIRSFKKKKRIGVLCSRTLRFQIRYSGESPPDGGSNRSGPDGITHICSSRLTRTGTVTAGT